MLWHSLAVAFLLLGVSTGVAAADSPWHRSVGGLEIYLGVLPAQMVQGHDAEHGGKKAQRGSHHIVVAIFDGASKQRLEKAEVSARVGELGLSTETKHLDPMLVAGAASYGNYFAMREGALYRIAIQIARPGEHEPVSAIFEYKHFQGS